MCRSRPIGSDPRGRRRASVAHVARGRVRNTSLPTSHSLLPLHETVVNAIQACYQQFGDDLTRARLQVLIIRSPQEACTWDRSAAARPLTQSSDSRSPTTAWDSPQPTCSPSRLDSDHKSDLGCRGVGRLLWLKAFDRVFVQSAYMGEDGSLHARKFRFLEAKEVDERLPRRLLARHDRDGMCARKVTT